MINIRPEQNEDIAAVRRINEAAFEGSQEADIVDKLRQSCDDVLSLVAVDGDEVVGHILFSPTIVAGESEIIKGMGLAPMAVLPGRQKQGIGTALVNHGLAMLRERNCPFVIVLGHAEYYPRFGFQPASKFALSCQWAGVPDEAFMAIIFDAATMGDARGVVRYRDEFDAVM